MPNVSSTDNDGQGLLLTALVVSLLLGRSLAVWLDVRNLTEGALRRQVTGLNSAITSVRTFYATNVVGRALASRGSTQVIQNAEEE